MEIILLNEALKHQNYWKKSGNIKIQKRITKLIKSILETSYEGVGNPEALKYQLAGKWSRRIDKEHRLVYTILDDKLYIYILLEVIIRLINSKKFSIKKAPIIISRLYISYKLRFNQCF
jgi:toxin YoeB